MTVVEVEVKTCKWCGDTLIGRQPTAGYCKPAHRSAAWRARQLRPRTSANGSVFEFPAGGQAQPCRCENPIPQLDDDSSWSCFKCGSPLGEGK